MTYLIGYSQEVSWSNTFDSLKGIWIASSYYNAIETNHSPLDSKDSFDPNYPVAIRINPKEIHDDEVTFGYAILHDHLLHPEVSEYMIKAEDTIYEQGNFKINLKHKDSLSYYKTSSIYYFNYDWKSYLKWNTKTQHLELYRPKGSGHPETTITYKRITKQFDSDYQFPNPLYYYTRQHSLNGNYTLKDAQGKLLSSQFYIHDNGIINGYAPLNNYTFYFSTDIYCGLPATHDIALFCKDITNDNSPCKSYLLIRHSNQHISLHESKLRGKYKEQLTLGKKVYDVFKN